MLFTVEAILAILLFIGALMAFLTIAKYVFLDNKHEFDKAAFDFIAQYTDDATTKVMLFFTTFGNYQALVTANILLTCYFLFIRWHKWYSIKIPAVAISSLLLMFGLKNFFGRERPLIPLLEEARGLSFPSGHALMSVTFYGLLIYIIWHTVKKIRI